MFIMLLVANFAIAFIICFIIARIFRAPVGKILERLVAEEIYSAWSNYIIFAIYVVGISGGVRVWDLEKYITPGTTGTAPLELNSERWILEIYRTVIGALQSDAWMLMLFFIFALIAFVIVKGLELKKQPAANTEPVKRKK
jgi:predicted secreted protein